MLGMRLLKVLFTAEQDDMNRMAGVRESCIDLRKGQKIFKGVMSAESPKFLPQRYGS